MKKDMEINNRIKKRENVIAPKDIKIGDFIEDGFGNRGVVVENTHPWGFKRLQYSGYSVVNHPDPNWYCLVLNSEK
jgi:hypothetical protein